jgi:hypothetical protein
VQKAVAIIRGKISRAFYKREMRRKLRVEMEVLEKKEDV